MAVAVCGHKFYLHYQPIRVHSAQKTPDTGKVLEFITTFVRSMVAQEVE